MVQILSYNCGWKVNPKKSELIKLFVLLGFSWCILISCNNKVINHQSHASELTGIKIGDQVWASASLDVVTFRNGDSIPEVRSNEEWERAGKEGKPAWCYYENDLGKGKTYGRLYNWYAVNDPRGLSPEGWHVPTNEEWIALETFLGIPNAGTKLKCNKGWKANGNGDDSSKLCILPGGYRGKEGGFSGAGEFIYLSGSTEDKLEDSKDNKLFIWGRGLQFENKDMMRCGLDKEYGLYVRCIKDKL